ncbi:MAG TPA: YceI family protein [Thiobacillus sp.]|nr:MAG: polyisoprenoid-binding protein [Hydrogenophilales bacterium 28-61-11]OYZ57703.1 MAG: polyisoprenoid-binding protein [Hydrogenophilales bacterium 16-61-112]OZA46764.1 MAG: polyisoprenoid-binding protein [Hydrogenophilales bacterium 17-61-76]HQT70361.1 YceI family protein [Thiobacillus sp.]
MKPIIRYWALLAALATPAAHAVEYQTVLPRQSAIGFEFRQMGVPVAGGFKRFTTQMRFDPAKPEAASARIEIDLASIDAGSVEADDESAGKLWFNRSAYPKAVFTSSQIRALGNNRYELRGTLTLKGKSRVMIVPVTYSPGKNVATFDGVFILKRLEFGIGEGMWSDVATVANEVQVKFRIAASGK